jgi:hypothetical protein
VTGQGVLLALIGTAAVGSGIYLLALNLLTSNRDASIENNQLIVRTTGGRLIAAVALDQPFEARCIHYDRRRALYRVTQNQQTTRFAVSRDESGDVVKALKLPWPPSTTSYGSWTR